eukprot:TRINITY_DN1031_c0_g2_i1.p1 TRINITY_DN1031_c0_g2~~TRINITY_DN1031_c0_g2_i1.p1  ORF type:complete len:129 (-),score=56.56 TRINITY_DN1031_c0_g2_i1:123-488(-)
MIEDEIDELKHTLIEHTMQIEEIKKTIAIKRKEQLSESDNEDDEENDGEDVEMMLNKHEEVLKTMRMEININDNENNVRNDINCNEINPNEMEIEEYESDESSEEMTDRSIGDRIAFIKEM